MQGFAYLVAAYAIAWAGLFAYLAVVMLRIRGVHTELAAVEELVRELVVGLHHGVDVRGVEQRDAFRHALVRGQHQQAVPA